MGSELRPAAWKTLLAFAIIYFVWGSTFLAIRVGVRELPPLLLAAMRFLTAGLALFFWAIARGERSPTSRQWLSAFFLGSLIFLMDYGLLFWAEQRVPSGIAAVMLAMILIAVISAIATVGSQSGGLWGNVDGNLTSVAAPGGTDAYTYDDRGLITSASGPQGASTFAYDADGRPTTKADASGTSTYTYTSRSQLASLADPLTGKTETRSYDDAGRLTQSDWGTGNDKRSYTYDDANRPCWISLGP